MPFISALFVFGISSDCPNIINLAIGLNLNIVQPATMSQVLSDCCTATGITCVSQLVTVIRWKSIGLTGFINGTAIPKTTTALYLDVNSIVGNIPDFSSTGIQNLWLNHNDLTGSLPVTYPAGFYEMHVDGNSLSGDLPVFPSSLTTCYLGWVGGGNLLTGTLVLNRPRIVGIITNWIADVIIADTSLITSCDLSQNPLLGNLRLPALTMCTKNSLYSPRKTLSSIQLTTTKYFTPLRTTLYSVAYSSSYSSFKTSSQLFLKSLSLNTFILVSLDARESNSFLQSYASESEPIDDILLSKSKTTQIKNGKKSTTLAFVNINPTDSQINDLMLTQMIVRVSINIIILC